MRAPAAAREEGRGGRSVPPLSEGQLHALWLGQRFPPGALTTSEGARVEVLYRGRPSAGAGPDFRDALLLAGGLPRRGDVELHVRSSDFHRHGHHRDLAYSRLALHLVFEDDVGSPTPLPGGGLAPVVALAPWVARRRGQLARWLAEPPRWEEPCRSAVARLGTLEVSSTLERLGLERLRERGERWQRRLATEGPDQALYAGVLEACGYGPNRGAFRALAVVLPWREAAAGLPGSLLRASGLTGGPGALPASAWQLSGLRPRNHPRARLHGVGLLLRRLARPALAEGALRAVQGAPDGRHLAAALVVREGEVTLIGTGRAVEVAANALLPFALARAWQGGGEGLAARVEALYRELPDPGGYGVTAFLERNLALSGRIAAVRRQGLLHLVGGYCSQGGCGRCPLS